MGGYNGWSPGNVARQREDIREMREDSQRVPALLREVPRERRHYISRYLANMLGRTIEEINETPEEDRTAAWLVARAMIGGAIAANPKLVAEVLDRTEGKVVTPIQPVLPDMGPDSNGAVRNYDDLELAHRIISVLDRANIPDTDDDAQPAATNGTSKSIAGQHSTNTTTGGMPPTKKKEKKGADRGSKKSKTGKANLLAGRKP